MNAIEAATDPSGKPGTVSVELHRSTSGSADSGAQIYLQVLDSGPGPNAEMTSRLFEPFETSKPDGTGLGLSVAKEIADAHSATLTWHRKENLTCFEVIFPRP